MGTIEGQLENATSITSLHHLRDMWKSSRGTVLRIEFLAVFAIILSFFLAAFGSCRRWSNHWIVQKGFFAAHVLSLSLGTYSVGLMQSSSVKSEMYPIWTVSLFTLFACIDPVTTYYGLDYKGPLLRVVFGICINCGYVLLMSISTISNVVGNAAVIILSAITFIKSFHRSLALVHQRFVLRIRKKYERYTGERTIYSLRNELQSTFITLSAIDNVLRELMDELDVCVAFKLSKVLVGHFLGLGYRSKPDPKALASTDYIWALKVIEIELAFVYDGFFTGNQFLHYYSAKPASLWAMASLLGICFVIIATAIPGRITSRRSSASDPADGHGKVVDTTTADLVITLGILVSMALMQLLHLILCWTSDWARVTVAFAYIRRREDIGRRYWLRWWLRLKVAVATGPNWFNKYRWQDKIGQSSLLPGEGRLLLITRRFMYTWSDRYFVRSRCICYGTFHATRGRFRRLVYISGLGHIWEVLRDLFGSDGNKRAGIISLDQDVKASVIEFLGQIKSGILDGNWLPFPDHHHVIKHFLPFVNDHTHGYRYTSSVMIWHVATWYCELVTKEQEKQQDSLSKAEEELIAAGCMGTTAGYLKRAAAAAGRGRFRKAGGGGTHKDRNRRVANALSKYCAYLAVSAPELLPGPVQGTKRAYDEYAKRIKQVMDRDPEMEKLVGAMSDPQLLAHLCAADHQGSRDDVTRGFDKDEFWDGIRLAKVLLDDPPPFGVRSTRGSVSEMMWETLAHVWVRLLVYAAPYGNKETHLQRLAQGGEFITHLWALLFHLDICEWKHPETTNLHNITTVDDAQRILAEDGLAVIAYLDSESGSDNDELATASRLEHGIRFYRTSNPDVAHLFRIDPNKRRPALVFMNKAEDRFTSYDGEFRAYEIAWFVTATNRAFDAMLRAKEIFGNQITTQISENGGQTTEEEIEEETTHTTVLNPKHI